MFSLSILAFSSLFISDVLSAPRILDSSSNTSTGALGPVAQLRVVNQYIAPDGYNRSATLVNGVYPAPLIQAQKGDQFSVYATNELTDPTMPLETTIHWHGIFQNRSNWADGVAYVTQCPLLQQEAFEYRFNVANQSGTYWYHSHYSTQYCDGLRGALVIYDPDDPLGYLYDVDDASTVITLSDWYHLPSNVLGEIFAPVFDNSTLINGRGRYPGGPPAPLSVVNVTEGLRYRFRLVATSCQPSFNFSIDGHRMTIIEADGNEVVPVDVDSLAIYPGQRYSVVVTANQTAGNFWIRALSSQTGASFEGGQNLAILRYAGAPDEDPTSEPGPYELAFDETSLHPLINPSAPGVPEIGQADVNIELTAGITDSGYFTLNNVSFVNPSVPVLLQILSGAVHPSQLLPNGSVYVLPLNKVVEISFPNPTLAPGSPHPMHLHGHSFSVVRAAGSDVANFVNPVRRDVVSLGSAATDNVVIRFTTNNPGPWFLHCHIDWHLNHGFGVVMAEAPSQTAEDEAPLIPQDWYDLCPPGESWGQTQLGLPSN